MRDYAELQLRRNRLVVAGLALAFALQLLVSPLVARHGARPVGEILNAFLLFWTLLGLPLSALLIGAASGASLRVEPNRSADEPLPLSPAARLCGALAAALLQLASVCGLVLAAALLFSPGFRSLLPSEMNFAAPFLKSAVAALAVPLVAGLFSSFAFAYALRHALAGGLLAAAATTAAALPLMAGLALEDVIGPRAPFSGLAIAAGLAAAAGPLGALVRLGPWAERGRRLARRDWAVVAAGLLGGALLALGAFEYGTRRAARSLRFVGGRLYLSDVAHAVPPPTRGALLSSLAGELVFFDGQGRRTRLIEPARRSLTELMDASIGYEQAAWDRDGRLCVFSDRFHELGASVRCGRIETGLSLVARLPRALGVYGIHGTGAGIVLLGWRDSKHRHAFVPKEGSAFVWHEGVPRVDALAGELGYDSRDYAKLSADRRRLSARGLPDCRLPGRAEVSPLDHPWVPARRLGARTVFTAVVELENGARGLAVCESGKARVAWMGDAQTSFQLRALPDGTLWGWRDGDRLHLAGADGFVEPMRVEWGTRAALGHVELVRRAEGSLWFLAKRRLFRVEERSGRAVESWPVPERERLEAESERSHQIVDGGLVLHDGKRLWLIAWDGSRKKLGGA